MGSVRQLFNSSGAIADSYDYAVEVDGYVFDNLSNGMDFQTWKGAISSSGDGLSFENIPFSEWNP